MPDGGIVEDREMENRDADIIAIIQSCTIAWPEACQQIAGLAATARDERDALQERIGEVQAAWRSVMKALDDNSERTFWNAQQRMDAALRAAGEGG